MVFARAARGALLAWVALETAQVLVALLVPVPSLGGARQLAWTALSNALVVAALAWLASRSDWRGLRLGAALAAIPFAIAAVNIFEGGYFLPGTGFDAPRLGIQAAITYALMVPAWAWVLGRGEPAPAPRFHPWGERRFFGRAWRLVVSDLAYLVIYLAGGFAILGLVREYYSTRPLPTPGIIMALQLAVRGPVFAVVCVALVRMVGMPRWRGAFAVAAVFSLVSGVAPLVVPTPYIADAIRWVHFCEVSVTNFIYAFLMAALWSGRQPALMESARSPGLAQSIQSGSGNSKNTRLSPPAQRARSIVK
jgi:hypothetical protein